MTARASQKFRPASEDTEVALKLWVVLNRASRAISGRIRASVERNDLSLSEFGVLEALYARGPLLVGEVGSKVLLTSGSMTYVIDKLEDRGLLVRRPSPEDRRALRVELTGKGRRLIARIFPEHAEQIRKAMSGLSAGEQRELTVMMKRLGLHAQENG